MDDVLITGTDTNKISQLKSYFDNTFKIKDLDKLHYFLDLEILPTTGRALISQRKFVLYLLKEYDCFDYTPLCSPLDPTIKLKAKEGEPLSDPTYYRKLIGKLHFLTNTRLVIAFSVQQLSQYIPDPVPHLMAIFHLLRYLKKDPALGIHLSKDPDCILKAYCDSDCASCPDTRRSVSGYLILLGNSPISWKCRSKRLYPCHQLKQNIDHSKKLLEC